MFLLLSVVTLVLFLIHIIFNYNVTARLLKQMPGPKDRFIVGNALEIILSPVELFAFGRALAQKFNGIYRFWSFPIGAVNIYNPEDIEVIISGTTFNDKSMVYLFLKPWLGEGLLVSNGSKWQKRRKILTPAFHFKILRKYFVILEENSLRLVNTLETTKGDPVDIVPLLSDCALHSICETAMGIRLSDEENREGKSYKEAIHELGRLLVERFTRIHLYSDFLFNLSSLGKKQKKCVDIIHNFTENVIKKRKKCIENNEVDINENIEDTENIYMCDKKNKIAMLDSLIKVQKDGLIDDIGIREEVDTFTFEGHDTTASALVYCLMLLANHKNIQDKVVAELLDIFGDDPHRKATIEELSSLRYLDLCIKESLRLYPSVPFISRKLNEEIILSNYKIPKGTLCHIHIYDLHRREDLYENALEYNPDRFLPENSIGRHPYSYIPFSAGPRNCIGQKFALMQMKLIISGVLRKYEILPVTKPSDLKFIADLVLRNSGPVYAKFVNRKY